MSVLFSDRRCAGESPLVLRRNQTHLRSSRPGWNDSARDSIEKGIGGMAPVAKRREIATSAILLTMERRMQQKYMDFDEPHTL